MIFPNNSDNIKTDKGLKAFILFKPIKGGLAETAPFLWGDGLFWKAVVKAAASLNLYKDYDLLVSGNDVNLTPSATIVGLQDLIALTSEIGRGQGLRLLAQRGRAPLFGGGHRENSADVPEKGRSGPGPAGVLWCHSPYFEQSCSEDNPDEDVP